jgi:hypothetical protein
VTLVEFLAPVARSGTNLDRVLGVLYFVARYEQVVALTSEQIKVNLRRARVKGAKTVNVSDVLSKSGHFATLAGEAGRAKLWALTDAGSASVRKTLGLPEGDVEIEHDVGVLNKLVAKLSNPDVRGYFEEAIKCLQVGSLRACVVFVWAGTIRTIQERIILKGSIAVTAALKAHNPKAREVKTINDLAYSRESEQLQIAQDLGLIDKGEKRVLGDALDLRNNCGHPGNVSGNYATY